MTIKEKLDLADAYLKGEGQPKDEKKAALLYHEAALEESRIGCRKFARCHRDAKGVVKDHAEAIKWYKKAIELGDKISYYELGWILYNSPNKLLRNVDEAEGCFIESIKLNASVSLSYFQLGRIELEGYHNRPIRVEKGIAYLEKSIELGNASAGCYLGEVYFDGKTVEQDFKKAVDCFVSGVDAGFARSMIDLGDCYRLGKGVEKDEKKAMELYLRAEKLKHPSAVNSKFNLMLRAEDPKVRDVSSAYDYMKHCVDENRDPTGVYALELGWLYRDGCELFEPDKETAKRYFEAAHAKGKSGGTVALIKLCLENSIDPSQCEKAYQLASEYGRQQWIDKAWEAMISHMDQTELRRAASVKYTETQYPMSFAAYSKLSELSDDAYYALGMMTLMGRGTVRDYAKGNEYLKKAAAGGMKEAKRALSLIKSGEYEVKVINCPYCGSPVSSESEKYHCEACGGSYYIYAVDEAESILHFNRSTRLRQNGSFIEAERELDALGFTEHSVGWYRALCRYGIRFIEGPALFYIERIRDVPFSKFCNSLSKGLANVKEYEPLIAQIDERCRAILQMAEETNVRADIVIATDPSDAKAVKFSTQLRDTLSPAVDTELMTDPDIDSDITEARRIHALKKACVFVRVISDPKNISSGTVSNLLKRFKGNSIGAEYQRLLTVALFDGFKAEEGHVIENATVDRAIALAKELLIPWFSTYKNIAITKKTTSSDILREVNRTRAILGLEPFPDQVAPDISCIVFEVAHDTKRFSTEMDFYESGCIFNYFDKEFRISVETPDVLRKNSDIKIHYNFYDMDGNLYTDDEVTIHIEKREKKPIRRLSRTWYTHIPSTQKPLFEPGIYYVVAQIEGRTPLGTCFAVKTL